MQKKAIALFIAATLFCLNIVGCSLLPDTPGKQEEKTVELYQLTPNKDSLIQSYVIKTKNNKIIVIDGGIETPNMETDIYLPAAIRSILGLGQNDYFEVEAWFLSHNHSDHINELAKMLMAYDSEANYKIKKVLFDFPAYGTEEYPDHNVDMYAWENLKMGLTNYATVNNIAVKGDSYYDDLNGSLINKESVERGLALNIDGVGIQVLQTWGDANDGKDVNNNSLVLRFTVEGQTILFLNDLGLNGEQRLLNGKWKHLLKSDIVQMAHHGQNGISKAGYEIIDADVHLWCTPSWVWYSPVGQYQIHEVRSWVNNGVDFNKSDARNIVSCLYEAYPEDITKVEDWTAVKDGMKLTLPYIYE